MTDLFVYKEKKEKGETSYTASDIEVLEGLEPVRMRPGMYIGGTDINSMHHLVSEVIDNAMDEAVAGYATKINIEMLPCGSVAIGDNGRGIPIDKHPKFPEKSALEVILTALHSGGKFSNKVYQTSGGLHGVGISVVNALSERLVVEVFKAGALYSQHFSKGKPISGLTSETISKRLRGTKVTFKPDSEIFGNLSLKPKTVFDMAKSKAYLYKGVEIFWKCDPSLIKNDEIQEETIIHFPGGLKDYLESSFEKSQIIGNEYFSGSSQIKSENVKLEWAICWSESETLTRSYCNTIPTPLGGSHEQGLRAALNRSVKIFSEVIGIKKAQQIIIDDIMETACIMLSVFISDPVFQGQTKEKLVSKGVAKQVETVIKDNFDHWLSSNKEVSIRIIEHFISNAEYRLNRKNERIVNRKTVMQKLRLPGKLADCSNTSSKNTELFIVEGDSAGGSAKQARDRKTQAILPLKGKILNVANANSQKISQNNEIQDLEIALNCGVMQNYDENKLRYEKIILMTDADVDGAHIASLLMTFFFLRMRPLIENGHLYLAKPPLYRLVQGDKTYYAANDDEKNKLLKQLNKSRQKIEVGRFKGLGEMTMRQLKETTMDPKIRILYKVKIEDFDEVNKLVDDLMGKKPEKRFEFIQNQALRKNKEDLYV